MARQRSQQTRRSGTSRKTTAKSSGRTQTKRTQAKRTTNRSNGSKSGIEALNKTELVERLDKKLGRMKRDELQKLLEGVEAGRVNLATIGSRRSSASRATTARSATGIAPPQARGSAKPPPLGSVKLDSLRDVLVEQLEDLHSAETQLVDALPKVARAASNTELRQALEHHLEETRGHVRRLEQIFGQVGVGAPSEYCEGMEGLIREGEQIIAAKGDPSAKDAALIAAAQRVEHYEIAGYGTARTLADELGLDEASRLLDETLDEESKADELLTRIATGGRFGSGINEEAAEEA